MAQCFIHLTRLNATNFSEFRMLSPIEKNFKFRLQIEMNVTNTIKEDKS